MILATRRKTRSRPTIVDVAKEAGVSVTTVSNVINKKDGNYKPSTKRRVDNAIERLGYRPQTAARGLRALSRQVVAMIVVDESESYLLDPFVANVVVGFSRECNERGYLTVLHGCSRHDLGKTVALRQISVDGFCLLLSGDQEHRTRTISQVVKLGHPVVLVQETGQRASGDICVVRQDDVDGGRQICEHLLARGSRRILVVLPRLEWPALEARLEGIRKTAKRSRLSVTVNTLVCPSEQFEDVSQAIDRHLAASDKPDAIIGANDRIATAVLAVLHNRNLRVPNDILVTGFNAFEAWRSRSPSLTTVTSPALKLGEVAARAMIDRIETGSFAEQEIMLPVRLQIGETT